MRISDWSSDVCSSDLSFLEDLDSTNGTQVNGKTITKHPLSHGDVITIGRNTLKYEAEASAGDDFEKTMILKPGQYGAAFESQVQAATASTPPPASNKPLLGKLRVTSGANARKELELSNTMTTNGTTGGQVAADTTPAGRHNTVHARAHTATSS